MKKIVVGYDGSEHARKALDRAAELADGATVIVVSVVQVVATPSVHGPPFPVDADPVDELEEELAEAKSVLNARGVEVRLVEGLGEPAEAICEAARQEGADLIVVGTRGHNALARVLLGSVSTSVVRHAPCDVLVVR